MYYSYNAIGSFNPHLESLVQHSRHIHTHISRRCEIKAPAAADRLVHHGKLRDAEDFLAIAQVLKQYI